VAAGLVLDPDPSHLTHPGVNIVPSGGR
jgi:hypothetical protein